MNVIKTLDKNRENVAWFATCQGVGMTLGQLIGYNYFIFVAPLRLDHLDRKN